mmetsp:Transcript_107469/g.272694  ORF Transcript_107469/g.272694 Transcript_107469/m.272694 type:complete len:214 (+) Transcript_107469:406-1047(+)
MQRPNRLTEDLVVEIIIALEVAHKRDFVGLDELGVLLGRCERRRVMQICTIRVFAHVLGQHPLLTFRATLIPIPDLLEVLGLHLHRPTELVHHIRRHHAWLHPLLRHLPVLVGVNATEMYPRPLPLGCQLLELSIDVDIQAALCRVEQDVDVVIVLYELVQIEAALALLLSELHHGVLFGALLARLRGTQRPSREAHRSSEQRRSPRAPGWHR